MLKRLSDSDRLIWLALGEWGASELFLRGRPKRRLIVGFGLIGQVILYVNFESMAL